MKRLVVILFSVVLVYGGVAWALGRCLGHADDHEHSLEERHSLSLLSDSHKSFSPFIHCPTAELRIGPAAQSGSARFQYSQRAATNHAAWVYEPAQPGLGNSRWLDAVFRPILAFSQTGDTSRYLLFSVLQI